MMNPELKEFLDMAAAREPGDEVELSIRELLQKWGAQKRGYWYVQEIRQDLETHGLVTDPPFTSGSIDTPVRLHNPKATMKMLGERREQQDASGQAIAPVDPGSASENQQTESALMEGALTFAHLHDALFGETPPPVVSISENDSLVRAQSLMMQHDYSQLPVTAGKWELKGVISWESIARTLMHRPQATLKECVIAADVVKLSDDVLTNIPKIIKNQFVVVQDRTKRTVGMVTTADLAAAFELLSGPFLMIGVAESKLRQVAEAAFDEQTIRDACGFSSPARPVEGLTLGELKGLFEKPENWDKLGWNVDRVVFCSLLQDVVDLRNSVMHFRAGETRGTGLRGVRNLLTWLSHLID